MPWSLEQNRYELLSIVRKHYALESLRLDPTSLNQNSSCLINTTTLQVLLLIDQRLRHQRLTCLISRSTSNRRHPSNSSIQRSCITIHTTNNQHVILLNSNSSFLLRLTVI